MENDELYFDYKTFKEVSLELVNNLRNIKDLEPLKYSDILEKGAQIRADELMEYGNIAIDGVPHLRPDGSSYVQAFSYIDRSRYIIETLGENLAYVGHYLIDASLPKNEAAEQLAVQLFHNWENSPGHYENMLKSNYKELAIGVSVKYAIERRRLGYIRVTIIGVQSFGHIIEI